jgi:hypothetical protein
MRRDLFEGALPAGQYQSKVLKSPVSRKALRGDDIALPAPYNKRGTIKEAEVMRACRDVLQAHGVFFRRIEGSGKLIHGKSGAMLVRSEMIGMPDFICCVEGRLIAIEVKCPGGRLSTAQYGTLRAIRDAGGLSLVVCDASKLAESLKTTPWTIHVTAIIDNWLIVV